MAAAERGIEVAFTEEELVDLERVSRSRTEPASHVQRACILLTYRRDALALRDRARDRRDASDGQAVLAARAELRRHGGSRR